MKAQTCQASLLVLSALLATKALCTSGFTVYFFWFRFKVLEFRVKALGFGAKGFPTQELVKLKHEQAARLPAQPREALLHRFHPRRPLFSGFRI